MIVRQRRQHQQNSHSYTIGTSQRMGLDLVRNDEIFLSRSILALPDQASPTQEDVILTSASS